jgi:hypothetical protein
MKFALALLLAISFQLKAAEYTPTNFTGDKEEIRDLFDNLWSSFKEMDNFHCYRRAHVLSYQMSKMEINSMKVFFLRGDKLRMQMNWYYHVAPLVYYNGEGIVLDRALLEGATFLEDWLKAFGDEHQCLEVKSMDEYREKKVYQYCLYLIVPMYYYGPLDLEELNITSFRVEDLRDMIYALPQRKRDDYVALYPIEQQ